MDDVTFPTAVPFSGADCPMSKVQALKVLEESAELVEAVKGYETAGSWRPLLRSDVINEAMDVYQAIANLLAGEFTGGEIARAYARCVERNRKRGRY